MTRQGMLCILAYGFIWACAFNLLWFLVSNGSEYIHNSPDFGSFLLPLAWNALCPDWPFFVMGSILGLLTCACLPRLGGAVKSSLLWSLLPATAIVTMFGFTASGLLPALLAVAASYVAGAVIARTWQQPLFAVPVVGHSLIPKKVVVVLAWLLALSIPFRLFELLGPAWSRGMGTEITETDAALSADGAYVAVIHNVNPGAVGDYSDVIVRPRHTILGLFYTYSASARYMGIDDIRWTGRHTLSVWRSYDAGQQQWHDVQIVYIDTRGPEEKKEDDALKRAVL